MKPLFKHRSVGPKKGRAFSPIRYDNVAKIKPKKNGFVSGTVICDYQEISGKLKLDKN